MIDYDDIGALASPDETETYWIPADSQDRVAKSSFKEIDYLIRGFVLNKEQVDEKQLEKAIAMHQYVLSPTSVMTRVKAGQFIMGNFENDRKGHPDEKPAHDVTLTYDFWLGMYPVTVWEFNRFCLATSHKRSKEKMKGSGPRPVTSVSWWYDVIVFCNWLSLREGLPRAYDEIGNLLDPEGERTEDISVVEGYRLPTEAEWEYAARGGHKKTKRYKYSGSDNLNEVGWYDRNSSSRQRSLSPFPVGKKKPNELGIYDMSGNVWECCSDRMGKYLPESQVNPIGATRGNARIHRGGSFYHLNEHCRVAYRGASFPDSVSSTRGFRVARTIR